jgi:hypothetical protein
MGGSMPLAPEYPTKADPQGIGFVRRRVNETTYEMAIENGVDADLQLEFMCECGRLECSDQIVLLLSQFDRSAPIGALVAHPPE